MKKLLFQGRYEQVLKQTPRPIARGDITTMIGALSFLGRIDEAESLYRAHPKLKLAEHIEARFFLSLGLIRTSEYARARVYLAENLLAARDLKGEAKFYAQQGVAFYRYFCGRWDSALASAHNALSAAIAADFTYGHILASDLRGHLLVQVANVDQGLRELKTAADLARNFGHSAIAEASEISILSYEAQYGLRPQKIVGELKRKLKSLTATDTYSQAALLLELTRQLMLRGRLGEVRTLLDEASRLIYMFKNRRQEAILNLRWAFLSWLTSEPYRALSFTQSALRAIDPKVDRVLELSALGMELKIVSELKIPARKKALMQELQLKSRRFGGHVHRNILSRFDERYFGANQVTPGDRIGELINSADEQEILKQGYLFFLYEKLSIPLNERTLYLDLTSDSSVVFDRGEVHMASGSTPLMRKLLETLARGYTSKEELVKQVWGYQYHPLRHDPLVYNTVLSLRKILGPHARWLETTETGYRLQHDVQLKFPVRQTKPAITREVSLASTLNHRQLQFLKKLKAGEFIHVKAYQELFEVAEITACRDLAMLHREGYVLRVGRARATRYALNTGGQL